MDRYKLTEFLDYVSKNYTKAIAKKYIKCVRLFTQYLDDNELILESISANDINAFIHSIEKTNLMMEYIIPAAITCYGEFMHLDNVKAKYVKYEDDNSSCRIVSKDYVEKLLCDNDVTFRQKLFIKLAYDYSFKRKDIVNLKFSDIDIEHAEIQRGSKTLSTDEEFEQLYTKYYIDLMSNIDKWQETRRKRNRPERGYSEYVFQTSKTLKPSENVVDKDLKKLNINVEILRNSQKVYLLKQGYSGAEVLEASGTDNYDSVIRLYKYII